MSLQLSAQRVTLALVVLVGTALSCILSGPSAEVTPTVSLSTATPGGSISISLLTPTTAVQAGDAQVTTPIGPVMTATAAYATAQAATATAAAPTPTVPGVFTEPAVCPSLGSPSLPEEPPTFTQYPEVIVRYLSAGGPPTILEATLRGWGALTEYGGLVRADRDFTGDGVPEVFIVLLDPQNADMAPQPGDLYVFGCEEGAYRLLYQGGYAVDRGAPVVISADDINGNLLNDLVYTVESCGATACYKTVRIMQWSLTLGNFIDLTNDEIIEPFPEVVISDVDEDGLYEVVVTSGAIASPEAGPQRPVTTIWQWDGTLYAVSHVITAPAEYRIHMIHDGDTALEAGDFDGALDSYLQAVEDERLLSWELPNEWLYLRAYAMYRSMLANVLRNDLAAAQVTYDTLLAEFVPTPPPPPEGEPPPETAPTPTLIGPGVFRPGEVYAHMAEVFWLDFAINRNLVVACQLTVAYVQANPEALEVLNSFGYANRQYVAEDMCPFLVPPPTPAP